MKTTSRITSQYPPNHWRILARMARLTFPDQQQDLQNAADFGLASECDGDVKFPTVWLPDQTLKMGWEMELGLSSGSRSGAIWLLGEGSGRFLRLNPCCGALGPVRRAIVSVAQRLE